MLIEAYTYRMGAHTTSDDPTRYRVAEELEHWRSRDPIDRVRAYLTRNDAVDDAFFSALEAESDQVAERVRTGCLEMPDPSPLSVFDNVYVEQTPELAEQREQFAAYLSSFEGGHA
jgi:pyruvate dehydrogenase E1 component alpha subunit